MIKINTNKSIDKETYCICLRDTFYNNVRVGGLAPRRSVRGIRSLCSGTAPLPLSSSSVGSEKDEIIGIFTFKASGRVINSHTCKQTNKHAGKYSQLMVFQHRNYVIIKKYAYELKTQYRRFQIISRFVVALMEVRIEYCRLWYLNP